MENLTLMRWMTECSAEFRFHKSDLPVLSVALHVNKEQIYATKLKGRVSHFEGLRTHVDSAI